VVLRHPWSITPLLLAALALAPGPTPDTQPQFGSRNVRSAAICPKAPVKSPSGPEPDGLTANDVVAGGVPYAVSVTPDGSPATVTANTNGNTRNFTVTNTGDCPDTYSLSYSATGPITSVSLSKTSGTGTVTATFSVGAPGTGVLTLYADGTIGGASDQGSYNVTVTPPPYVVAVTPDGTPTASRSSNSSGFTDTFTVKNNGGSADSYTVTCGGSGVTCTGASPATITNLAAGASQLVVAQYTTGAVGTDTLTLTATSTHTSDGGSRPVPIVKASVAVTPDGTADPQRRSGEAYTDTFTVRNTGTGTTSFTVTASCTGAAIASGCTASPTSLTLAGGVTGAVAVSYTAGPVSSTGQANARATQTADSTVRDTGWITVTVGTTQKPVIDVVSVNPGTTRERGLCLTIAAGAAAAAECADLRIVHPLPSVRSRNKVRTPTLIYNSAEARPYALVAANVALPATAANPDSVYATLKTGVVVRGTAKWAGGDWKAGSATRIVVADTTSADTTGVYIYTLAVTNWWNGATAMTDTQMVKIPVIARQKTPFGAGWSLAGVERLYPRLDSMLWVGGDGSTRQYTSAGTNVWAAPNVDRPDTLKKDPVLKLYTRFLPHGVRVVFDTLGHHIFTVNRLSDTTRFTWSGGDTLLTITLPRTGLSYRFNYTSGSRWWVTPPTTSGQARVDTGTVSGGRLQAIRGPDTARVSFVYFTGPDSNVIQSRADRKGHVASYTFDGGKKLIRSSVNMGPGQPAVVRIWRPLETFGLPAGGAIHAPDTATAYARFDGPRTDVADTSLFWLDRYGQPRRIRDALGDTTRLVRGDTAWPALVTRAVYANGRIVGATYDNHGNVTTVTDSSVFQNGRYATTRHVWNRSWDFDSIAVPPEGDSVVISYSATNGNRLWQQDARGATSRVSFSYYATGKASSLLSAVQTPIQAALGVRDSIFYDSLGNVLRTKTPLGFVTTSYRDSLGRDTLVTSPIDSAQTAFQTHRVRYDIMDRDTMTVDSGPSATAPAFGVAPQPVSVPAQTVTVRKHYDPEGNVDTLSRRTDPDTNHVGWITTKWRYNFADRKVAEVAPDGWVDSTVYDPAGNADTLVTRRGHVIPMTYDVLNRLTQRIVPSTSYPDTITCAPGGFNPCPGRFPMYHFGPGGGLTVPADTATFAYDSVGNMRRANNRWARVGRSYNRNGTLATDTLRIASYGQFTAPGDTTTHVYGLRYGYDLDGRRTWLKHPGSVAPIDTGVVRDSTAYGYDVAGQLVTVRDIEGNAFRYVYDLDGRLDSLAMPGQTFQKAYYDAGGRLQRRLEKRAGTVTVFDDTLSYDARGKILQVRDLNAGAFYNWYSGLGALLRAYRDVGDGADEDKLTDGLANMYKTIDYPLSNDPPTYFFTYQPGVGRLTLIAGKATSPKYQYDTSFSRYDRAGNRYWQDNRRPSNLSSQDLTYSYLGADQKPRVVERITFGQEHYTDAGVWEEYRYDALGRRVLLRARLDSTKANCGPNNALCGPVNRNSYIERTIWDGDAVLYEIRAPGGDPATTSQLENDATYVDTIGAPYGRTIYTTGADLDHPLDVIRVGYSYGYGSLPGYPGPIVVVPHYNWRGHGLMATLPDGSDASGLSQTVGGTTAYLKIDWPALTTDVGLRRPSPGEPVPWFGNVLEQQRDLSQNLYMRNRYYDPATGKFTQEDPLGLAGGLNLYGFANGDPVNFSDPFGLCPLLIFCGVEYAPGVTPPSSLRVTTFLHVLALVEQRNVIVESGTRSQGHNEQVHGATDSCHLSGCAADIHLEGESNPETAQAVYGHSTIRSALGIREIYEADPANGHTGTHVDTRTSIGDRFEPRQPKTDPKKIHYVPLKPEDMQ
jgi:RHS repeat-associated protein